jgi:hypothetical protein
MVQQDEPGGVTRTYTTPLHMDATGGYSFTRHYRLSVRAVRMLFGRTAAQLHMSRHARRKGTS